MKKVHAEILINGIVQGVGFRPFIHKRVSRFSLAGEIRNTSFGVSVSLEGEREKIEAFLDGICDEKPPLCEIYEIKKEYSETLSGYTGFTICESEEGERKTLISPDAAVCDECLAELFDESDRRYRYPFINCTNCGPRFTITKDIPYDRKNTTMSHFPMCENCAAEYGDIESRRYHAQPDCCDECGPRLYFLDSEGREISGDAIALSQKLLRDGKICAIKGLGGVHLAVRADDEISVRRLRERKRRDEKPFALMCRDVSVARRIAEISDEEEKILTSPRRPIILLRKSDKNSYKYISENEYLGIMLPYTPVHHLLFDGGEDILVMTSANLSDTPIVYKDEEMTERLSGIADGCLTNNREIFVRCDDSLAWVIGGREYFARRSRGYAPHPVRVSGVKKKILACGAEQKASFSVSRDSEVFPSAHIGDLKNLKTLECYEEQIEHFKRIFDIIPEIIACDMHPDYMSSEYAKDAAEKLNVPLVMTQHHHAHMASCMADNGLDEKCIGIIWDGTGLGDDGMSWGAEFLVGDFKSVKRLGTISRIKLPGGDIATKEIFRTGVSLLENAGVDASVFGENSERIKRLLDADINCPQVTSMGRLFDGVSAILGICKNASYEGQGAILLEAAADEMCERIYPYEIKNENGMYVFCWQEMVRKIANEASRGVKTSEIAAAFMNTLVDMAVCIAKLISEDTGISKVVLSGGTFQNMYVLKRMVQRLSKENLLPYIHRQVSTNDEGISLGQLIIAEKGGGINVSCHTA